MFGTYILLASHSFVVLNVFDPVTPLSYHHKLTYPILGKENTKENNSNKRSAIGTTTTEANRNDINKSASLETEVNYCAQKKTSPKMRTTILSGWDNSLIRV
ncbi:hypothetical protein BgiBS90_034395 [Biomphalaria glabrata]|nr:hypothetical protein BgiBS90_034395 [Biomphalaria glabrata]